MNLDEVLVRMGIDVIGHRAAPHTQLVCSYLCFDSQLVGNLQLSQLQRQLEPVLCVCGHSKRLLFETLSRERNKTHQQATGTDGSCALNILHLFLFGNATELMGCKDIKKRKSSAVIYLYLLLQEMCNPCPLFLRNCG